jgi:hypothetical protein
MFLQLLTTLVLIILPTSLVWWLFFPLSLVTIVFLNRIYATIFAGFVLDIIYFASAYNNFPVMTTFSFVVSVIFVLFKDKLRLNQF